MTTIAPPRPKPDATDNPRARIGDNRPPPHVEAVADFNEAIDKRLDLRDRIAKLIDASTRATATDDDTAGRCAELIRQMTAAERVIEDERKLVKAPFLEAGRAIEDAANAVKEPLVQAKAKVRGLAETYMREAQRQQDELRRQQEADARRQREEQQARERAEAERAAAENRAPEPVEIAPPPPPAPIEPVRVRSDFGATASARKVWKGQVEDYGKAFKHVRDNPAVRDAVDKAVAALVRAGKRELTGVRIFEDVGLSVR